MKTVTIITLLVCYTGLTYAQTLYNNGAVLTIKTDAIITVNGETQLENGTTTNDGVLNVTGNIINNQTVNMPNGSLIFNGSSAQTLNSNSLLFVKDVTVNNSHGVTLGSPLKVDGVFNFVDGIINTGTNSIIFTNNASISSTNVASNTSHIKGTIIKEGIGNFVYPIGDGTSYQQVGLNLTNNTHGVQVTYITGDAGTAPFSNTGSSPTLLKSYNNAEYWDISPVSIGSAEGKVTLYWDNYNSHSFSSLSEVTIAHRTGGNWVNEGNSNATGSIASGRVTSNTLNTWSPFTIGSVNATLPIDLVRFEGQNTEGGNILTWQTAFEIDNKGFEVQSSQDGRLFEVLGFVQGNGNSSVLQNYEFVHQNPTANVTYYRLKQIDNKGTFAYSKIIDISSKTLKTSLLAYPNPSNGVVKLLGKPMNNVKAILTNEIGQSFHITINENQLSLANFQTGIYYLYLIEDQQRIKIIKY